MSELMEIFNTLGIGGTIFSIFFIGGIMLGLGFLSFSVVTWFVNLITEPVPDSNELPKCPYCRCPNVKTDQADQLEAAPADCKNNLSE